MRADPTRLGPARIRPAPPRILLGLRADPLFFLIFFNLFFYDKTFNV